jgi:tetratricopeptide (TPR) repeat protein
MSRQEVADAVNAHLAASGERCAIVDANYIGKLERGVHRWPGESKRRALRVVLDVGSDRELGFYIVGDDGSGDRLGYVAEHPRRLDARAIGSLATILKEQRRLEDVVGSAPLVESVVGQLGFIEGAVRETGGRLRRDVLGVAAQWAQFAGWLHTAGGRWTAAASCFGRALEWASEGDDHEMVATVLSYRAHAAWLQGQIGPVIGLSRAARHATGTYPGQRTYDAGQEARGHLVAADTRTALSLLAEADDLARATAEYHGEIPPWQYYREPWFFALERGLVLRYLADLQPRRADAAIAQLTTALAAIPQNMRGAEWAAEYRYHLAVTLLHAGDARTARTQARQARQVAVATGSTRLLAMLDRLVLAPQ